MSSQVIRPDPAVLITQHSSSEDDAHASRPPLQGVTIARRDTDTDSSGDAPRFSDKGKSFKTRQLSRRDSHGAGTVGLGGLVGMANMSVGGVRITTSQRVIAVDSDEEEESTSSAAAREVSRRSARTEEHQQQEQTNPAAAATRVSPRAAGGGGGAVVAVLKREESFPGRDAESSGESPAFRRMRKPQKTGLTESSSSSSEEEETPVPVPVPSMPVPTPARTAPSDIIRATPKLGKLLGGGAPGKGDVGRPRKRSVTLGEAPASAAGEAGDAVVSSASPTASGGDGSGSVSPRSNNMTKVSKFFGTVISQDTASALQSKAKTIRRPALSGFGNNEEAVGGSLRASGSASGENTRSTSRVGASAAPAGERASDTLRAVVSPQPLAAVPATRLRRSSSVGSFDSPSWTRERSPRSQGATRVSPRPAGGSDTPQVRSGRLSLTMWRPSGVVGKDKFWFEVAVDYVSVYKSPPLHNKKPEWTCNVCCDASLDSLIIIRLFKGTKEADKCHLRLAGLLQGSERVASLEFPGGERQQVTLLALDFGEPGGGGGAVSSPEKCVALDAPNVLDVVVSALHDLRLVSKGSLVMQASYTEQVMRSGKLWTEPESARIQDVGMDCTFRLCASNAELVLLLVGGDSFPGEVLCGARVSLLRATQWAPVLLPLRDKGGATRAFCQLRLSMSSPLRGMLGPSLGPPLMGVPLRLEWGDLVLFNLKSLSAQVVSAATASSWDHCGIVYEEDGKYFLLEAVSNGVQATELNSRVLDALNLGAKMAFRRLLLPRTPELRAELWSFAVGMTGRSYKKSVGQLVQSRWGRNKTDDLSSVFCSELVAAAYKQLGLLGEAVVTCNVLPKDLAGDFALQRGSLGPLIVYSAKLHGLLSSKHAAEFAAFVGNDDENSSDEL